MTQIAITDMLPMPMLHILQNLRPEDEQEIVAMRGDKFDRFRMSVELGKLASMHAGWIFWRDDTHEPIAALGAYPMTPVVAGCWACGTAQWPLAVKAVTKHIKRIMIPGLLKAGFHRAECRALASREDTERWLTGLGWKAEAVLSEFGTRREAFTLFAWVAPDEPTDPPERSKRESEVPVC